MIGWIVCPILLLLAIVGFAGDRIFYKIGVRENPKEPPKCYMRASNTFETVKYLSITAMIASILVFTFIDRVLCRADREYSETRVVWQAELAVVPSQDALANGESYSFVYEEDGVWKKLVKSAELVTIEELSEGSEETPRIEERKQYDMTETTWDSNKKIFFKKWWEQDKVTTYENTIKEYPSYYVVYVPFGTLSGNS